MAHYEPNTGRRGSLRRPSHSNRIAICRGLSRINIPDTFVSPGGVGQAIRRVEHGTAALQRTVKRLEQKLLNA